MKIDVGLYAIVSFCIGAAICYLLGKKTILKKYTTLLNKTDIKIKKIIKNAEKEGEFIKKNKLLQAQDQFIDIKLQHEKNIRFREKKILYKEYSIKKKETQLKNEIELYLKKKNYINNKIIDYEKRNILLIKKKEELKNIHNQQIKLLEKIANYSYKKAKYKLINKLKLEAQVKAQIDIKNIIKESQMKAKTEAKKLIIQSIQRINTEEIMENVISVFNIKSNDIKGKIIGKEGRNIRALEKATGVEIIVDDTPESILLSCFNPIRREIAKLSLNKLVIDGRIHPAKIEEIVSKTEKQIEKEIVEIGKKSIMDLGIYNIHNELIKLIGKMKYRFSYGQNLLQHAIEVSNLSSILSAELGLDTKSAKRAGILHDIGKIHDSSSELSHALLGMNLAEKYGESEIVCNAIGAHHDEISMKNIISPIIQISDSISGSRPGIRKNTFDSYLKRLKNLEDIAMSFHGVNKAFAIQAGRELRVLVESEKVNDEKAFQLSFEITEKIKNKMTYPGQIKITVIRETRAIQIAR